MSNAAIWGAAGAGVVGVLVLNIFLPFWLAVLVVLGIPVAGYFMLDESQRRRLKGINKRRRLGPGA